MRHEAKKSEFSELEEKKDDNNITTKFISNDDEEEEEEEEDEDLIEEEEEKEMELKLIELTADHKPDNAEERQRILKAGTMQKFCKRVHTLFIVIV